MGCRGLTLQGWHGIVVAWLALAWWAATSCMPAAQLGHCAKARAAKSLFFCLLFTSWQVHWQLHSVRSCAAATAVVWLELN